MLIFIHFYLGFCNLTTLTVELEDCIGEGFISFLKQKGSELR